MGFDDATAGSSTLRLAGVGATDEVTGGTSAPEAVTSRLTGALSCGTPVEAAATDDSATKVGAGAIDADAGTEALSADTGTSKVAMIPGASSISGALVVDLPGQEARKSSNAGVET